MICESISKISNITTLNLDFGYRDLLLNNKKLIHLKYTRINSLRNEGVKFIFENLSKLPILKHLTLNLR
jgi:hypothetical protein